MATSSRAWSLSGVRISVGDWRLSVGEMGVFPLYWSSRVPPVLPTLRLRPNLLSFIESLERERGFSSDWVSVTEINHVNTFLENVSLTHSGVIHLINLVVGSAPDELSCLSCGRIR